MPYTSWYFFIVSPLKAVEAILTFIIIITITLTVTQRKCFHWASVVSDLQKR